MYFKKKIRFFIFDSQSVKNTDTAKEKKYDKKYLESNDIL